MREQNTRISIGIKSGGVIFRNWIQKEQPALDGFVDDAGNALDFIADEAVDIAETVVNVVMVDRLKDTLPLLSDSEQALIKAIFL